ncbi:hypothetical protein EGW08_023225 [Elysia chlorotica]|uniref:Receptor ligand binding region domain-containing protein n=1 Tax=Elysia chlorotica TaxID=188477 RepID=A0A433SJ11_ELYCH|nr:hypothetical protein EGW08_023225 [Elysia chlorotica]
MNDPRPEVLAGVILPASGGRPFRLVRVKPALEKAVADLSEDGEKRWNFKKLTLLYADSKCDSGVTMNEAIQMAERKRVSVFFGPVCDYAVAPVARQAPYWNIPLITTGATAFNFQYDKARTYRTLTRVGPANLKGLHEFLEGVFQENIWFRFKFIYDSTGQDEILHAFCHLLVEYMHIYLMGMGSNITMDLQKIDMQDTPPDMGRVMREEVGADNAGAEKNNLKSSTKDSNRELCGSTGGRGGLGVEHRLLENEEDEEDEEE